MYGNQKREKKAAPYARRLRDLETENSKLKKLLAESELNKAALKDLLGRKW
jgi:putative transposase